MPNVYLPDSTFEQFRLAGKRAGFDMTRRGPGGQGVEFMRLLLDDNEHLRQIVASWNALVDGLQALGFRVWSGSDEGDTWSYQWDNGQRVSGFASDHEAIVAAVKARLAAPAKARRKRQEKPNHVRVFE